MTFPANTIIPVVPKAGGGWTANRGIPNIESITGALTQGGTAQVTGTGFSSVTSQPLLFTEFAGGTLGQRPATDIAGMTQPTDAITPADYQYSDDTPLTGTRIAKMSAIQTGIKGIDMPLPNLNKVYVEFWTRHLYQKFTSSPDSPQVKFSRISSGESHTVIPYLGTTVLGADASTAEQVLLNYENNNPGNQFPVGGAETQSAWHRHSQYIALGDVDVANGMIYYRTDFTNQWTFSATGNYFSTPDEWSEPGRVTRFAEHVGMTLQMFRLPFFHRAQQETIIDVNSVFINSSPERVILSTSPTFTASTAFKHVSCPITSRGSNALEFYSMIDALPPTDAVYAYVVNDDHSANTDGFLVRSVA